MVVGSIDTMFAQILLAPTWATMIAGFVVVLTIIFLGAMVFGKNKQDLGAFGFSILTFVGVLLATVLGLFPWYIIIIFLILGLVTVLFSKIFGGNNG